MTLQLLLTGLIVAACALYAAWALMPAALRRRLLRQPATAGGCGCSGCDAGRAPPRVGEVAVVTVQRRRR